MKKSSNKFIVALVMLLISAISLSTASYAWFSMNTTVTATGMTVKAQAEAGLVIADATTKTYDVSATSSNTTVRTLLPTSTNATAATWVHANSTNPNAATSTGMTYTTLEGADLTNQTYFAIHNYLIRSSAAETMTVASLDVKSVSAATPAQELSKSLRVAVVYGGATYIYAPVTGATLATEFKSQDTENKSAVTALAGSVVSNNTSVTSIPANTAEGVAVTVYVWFEGEDPACKSTNIVTNLEQIVVSVEFTFTAPQA